jgi:outer membrane receptor protein involved in Fe transport
VLSIGVFAKRFDKPIERIDIATGGQPFVSFFNAASASNLGVELEARKGLGGLSERLEPWRCSRTSRSCRATSKSARGPRPTRTPNRPMMGQAPWVANAGHYTGASSGLSATLLYSAVGPRIFSAGTVPFPDVYEQPRHLVDLSLRLPLGDRWTWRVDARNLLDAPYQLTQGP